MDEIDFSEMLEQALWEFDEDYNNIKKIKTFEDEMLLTTDKGIVVYFEKGDTFEITIVER